MNNLEVVNNEEFLQSRFEGIFEGIKITYIGQYCFLYSNFSGSLNLPMCTYIGGSAFSNSHFSGSLNLPVCTQIGIHAFYHSNFSGSLSLPACTFIGNSAFLNSNFNSITIGANATLGNYCIGAHSTEFINDYTANHKLAGTDVWDSATQHWRYQ